MSKDSPQSTARHEASRELASGGRERSRFPRSGRALRLLLILLELTGLGMPESACVGLSGAHIRAGELARHDARFHRMPPNTVLGFVPNPGERRMISPPGDGTGNGSAGAANTGAGNIAPGDMEDGNTDAGMVRHGNTGEGNAPLCVVRASAPLQEEAIRAALDLGGGESLSAVRVRVLRYSQGTYPLGILRFPRQGVSPPPAGATSVLWRGSIEYEPGRTTAVWAEVELQREGGCLRVRQAVRPGEAFREDLAEAAPCDAAAILAGALPSGGIPADRMEQLVVAGRGIRKGEWLTRAMVIRTPLVVARREASLAIQSGAARLVLPVIPEESGEDGATVWVRVAATRERLQAQVAGPDRLERVLPPKSGYASGVRQHLEPARH